MIIEKLISAGYLASAARPPANPTDWRKLRRCRGLTVPLIAEDYRALTAVMWNAAYNRWLPQYRNVMMVADPKRVGEILSLLAEDPRYLGGGLGVGFKEVEKLDLTQWLDLDPLAEKMGSVNLVVKTRDGLVGFNTDAEGYLWSLEERLAELEMSLEGKRILLLGAGGTANGIAHLLAERSVSELVILNRTVERAEVLAERINKERGRPVAIPGGEAEIRPRALTAHVIINASTKGADGPLAEFSALADTKDLPENLAASVTTLRDLVAKRPPVVLSDINLTKRGTTPFLEQAREVGFPELQLLDGRPMVVNQGYEAFWIIHRKELAKLGVTKDDVARIFCEAAEAAK